MQTIKDVDSAIKGFVRISEKGDTSDHLLFEISDISGTQYTNAPYYDITVSIQASSATDPFTSTNDDIIVSFVTSGDKGDQGATGSQGPEGAQGATGSQGPAGPQGCLLYTSPSPRD